MIDDKLKAQTIYHALAALSMDPSSAQMQDAVKKLLISSLVPSESRAIEIEKSNILSKVETTDTESQNSFEIENTPFQTKLTNLEKSYPQLKEEEQSLKPAIPQLTIDNTIRFDMAKICNMIYDLHQEYTQSLIKRKLIITEFWDKLAIAFQALTSDNKVRKFIGTNIADTLDTFLISIGGKVSKFEEARNIENEQKATVLENETKLMFGRALRLLNEIYNEIGCQVKE